MKKLLYLFVVVLMLGFASCENTKTTPTTPTQYLDADFLYIENGDLFFYAVETDTATMYPNEPDHVVDAVCSPNGMVYYNVVANGRLLLKCLDLNEADPQPTFLTDWDLDLTEDNEDGYPAYGSMMINKSFDQIALEVDLTWFAGLASNLAIYDCNQHTVSKLERFGDGWYDDMLNEDGFDVYRMEPNFDEALFEDSDGLFYLGEGKRISLSDRIDEEDYSGYDEYGMSREPIALNPSGTMLLFSETVGMGDGVFGFYAVSSLDGKEQQYIADVLDDDFIAPVWLSDGSLLFRGYDSDETLIRLHPDGDYETVANTHKFCLLH